MTPELNQDLAALVESLTTEADPQRRDRALFEAATRCASAVAVALWREAAGTWTCIAERGDARALPVASEVAGVVARELPAVLPSGRVVAHIGGRALALGGLDPTSDPEPLVDRLDALLLTAALVSEETGCEDLPDLVLPALPWGGAGVGGTHAPRPTDLADLRHLLSRLRSTQELLARGDGLEPADRERFALALDLGFEQAGDLLLTRLGQERAQVAGEVHLGPVLIAALATEEATARLAGVELELDLDEGALALPLAVGDGELLPLVLLALEVGLRGGRARVRARLARRGEAGLARTGVALRVEGPDLDCNPPGGSSLAQLLARAARHEARVEVVPRGLELWLPARARGLAA